MIETRMVPAALAREAENWVARLIDELADAQRSASGGWPGTISEARALVVSWLGTRAGAEAVVRDDVEGLVRAVYAAARREWRRAAASPRELDAAD